MKLSKYVLILITFLGFVFAGCSDKSQTPVEPVNNHSPLEKVIITNYSFTNFPIAAPTGGETRLTPGGKWQIKKVVILEQFISSDLLISGVMEHKLSLTIDAVTGEGPCQGSWILTPADLAASGGGVWEGKYNGYRSKSDIPGEWILPLKIVGHGKGGLIQGMQIFGNAVLIVRADDGSTTLPTSWIGTGEGFYKSHK